MEITPALPQSPATPSSSIPPAKPAEAPPAKPAEVAPENIEKAISELQRLAEAAVARSTDLQFSVDEATGKTVVSIVDAATKEVVRQIPSEDFFNMARALDRMQGMLIRSRA